MRAGLIGTLLLMQVLMEGEDTGGGSGGQGGQGGGNGGNSAADKKFSQTDVDRIVQDRLAQERRNSRFKPEDAEELQRLRDDTAARALKDAETAKNYEDAKASIVTGYETKLKQARDESGRYRTQLEDITIRQAIESIAAKSANDPTEISALLRGRVRLNAETLVPEVLKPGTTTVEHVNGEPMTVEQLVTSFLTRPDKKHLLRPTQRQPADGGEGNEGGDRAGEGQAVTAAEKEMATLKTDFDTKFKRAQQTGKSRAISVAGGPKDQTNAMSIARPAATKGATRAIMLAPESSNSAQIRSSPPRRTRRRDRASLTAQGMPRATRTR